MVGQGPLKAYIEVRILAPEQNGWYIELVL